MANLQVTVAGVPFKNPIIAASGTFGFGREYDELYDISLLGGISCKGTTLKARDGNKTPRIAETPMGMLNSVGLQNPGVDHFLKFDMPFLKSKDITIIANAAGNSIADYCEMCERLSDSDVDMIELNISCPNVKEGGAAFGVSCSAASEITKAVRAHCSKPLMVKLSPNVSNIGDIAAAVEDAGADAVSLINTLTGMRIDIETKRPILHNNTGGLSGPAVFPVAVRMVSEVFRRVSIPIIGMGGISSWQDAIEMMIAGASAVQIGAILFREPMAPFAILEGIEKYMDAHGIQSLSELTGTAQLWS